MSHGILKSLSRLVLVGALVVVALSVRPTSAQPLLFCDCSSTEQCVQRYGDLSYKCVFGGCKENNGLTGLCKKCKPDPNAICPLVYAPVTCSNGVTYSNQCFADADCATGCVPADVVVE
jgi:hypothetical protein